MTKKILPPPDKYASCPNEGRILEYYDGQFESVFILLHPFLRPTTIPPERFCPELWPSKQELIEGVQGVTWAEVLDLTNLTNIQQIDIGLRTSILGLPKELANVRFREELLELTDKHRIIHPSEGDIAPLLENTLYECLQHLGYKWLWLGDELCTQRNLKWIDNLKGTDEIPSNGCVFTPDKSILVTTQWDSHFSFLCGSRETIDKILSKQRLEGFYCEPETEVYWSVVN